MTDVTVRHRDDGPSRYRHTASGFRSEAGDEHAVDADLAEHLVGTGYFEYVAASADDADDAGPLRCEVVKNDGEVCDRELPCAYHEDY